MAYLGEDIKKLGFGLMRLPMIGDKIDMEQTIKMVDLFMQKGFTYFDTAYVYGDGLSEYAARDALVKRYQVQLDYYANVLENLLQKPVEDIVIYSFNFEKEIKLQNNK